jgi:transcriptional regulator with XRE-family HTH domain
MRRKIINWTRPLSPVRAQARAVVADFGRSVCARRLAAGLTQKDLARLCHVSAQFICEIERGQTNPSLETMARIAVALNSTVADLLPTVPAVSPVSMSADDVRRAHDAVAALQSLLTPRNPVGS